MATKFRNIHVDACDESESIDLQVFGASLVEGRDQNGPANRQGLLKGRVFKASATRCGTGRSSTSSHAQCGTSGLDVSSAEAKADGRRHSSVKIYQPS